MEQEYQELSDNSHLTYEIEIKPEKVELLSDEEYVIDQEQYRLENNESTELSIKYEPLEATDDEDYEPEESQIGAENRLIFKAGPDTTKKIAVRKLFLYKAAVKCGTCSYISTTWEDWQSHILHHKREIPDGKSQMPRPRKMHYCVFCHRDISNFARHMFRRHSNEIEIQKIKALPPFSQERKKMLANLRKKGNFLYRSESPRAVKSSPYKNIELLPCISCMGYYSAPYLSRHRKQCCGELLGHNIQHRTLAQNFLVKHLQVDSELKEKVFMRMRPDKVSLVAKSDPIICECATEYLRRSKNACKTSLKMRELAKLLMCAQNLDPSIKEMSDLLKTNHYWVLAQTIKILSGKEIDVDNVPLIVRNIIASLKQCCEIALSKLRIENSDTELERDIRKLRAYVQFNLRADIIGQKANDDDTKRSQILINNQAGQTVFQHWTSEQKNIVISHFDTNLKTKVQPKKEDCIKLKELYPDLLRSKSWLNIHKLVKSCIFRNKVSNDNSDNQTKRRVLVQWTNEQKSVANSYFREHINNGIPARKYECVKLIQLHRDLFWNKNWKKIKVYVQNQYVRNSKIGTSSADTQKEPSRVKVCGSRCLFQPGEDQNPSNIADNGRIILKDLEINLTSSGFEPLISGDAVDDQTLEIGTSSADTQKEPGEVKVGGSRCHFQPGEDQNPSSIADNGRIIVKDLEIDLTSSRLEPLISGDAVADQTLEFEPTLIEDSLEARISCDEAVALHLEVDSEKTDSSLKGRRNKKMRFCCLCEAKVKNYARHLISSHRKQVNLRNILCTSIYDSKRNIILTKFRRKRKQLMKEQLVRAGDENKHTTKKANKKFILCRNCQGYFRQSLFKEHRVQCKERLKFRKPAQENLLNTNKDSHVPPSFDAIRKSFDFYDSLEIKHILQTIRLDKTAVVGIGDVLICRYANQVFKKVTGTTVRHVVSNTIRELGRFLIHLRTMTNYDNLIETLRPELYDSLFEATKKISGYNSESKTFQYSYLPVKMGKELKEICKMAIKIIHKNGDIFKLKDKDQTVKNLKRLMTLIQHHWSSDLLKLESSRNEESIVPSDSSSDDESVDDKLDEPVYDQSMKVPRIKFTEEEKKAIRCFFKKHIEKKQSPKKLEVLEFMGEHKSLFKSKNWVKIKAFVYNEYRPR